MFPDVQGGDSIKEFFVLYSDSVVLVTQIHTHVKIHNAVHQKKFVFFFPPVGDFLGSPVVRNPPCKAGDMGSIPGQGTQIPHVAEELVCYCCSQRVHTPQQKIPHDPVRIPCATAKA